MEIRLHPHALERIVERSANEEEVRAALEGGEKFPANMAAPDFARTFLLTGNGTAGIMPPNKLRLVLWK